MTKVIAPLGSARASGAIDKKVVFFRRRGRNIARRYHIYPTYAPEIIPPVEVDLIYVECFIAWVSPENPGTWETQDCQFWGIPEAERVDISVLTTGTKTFGTRKLGSTTVRLIGVINAAHFNYTYLPCECKDSRYFQIYANNTDVKFACIGYWKKGTPT